MAVMKRAEALEPKCYGPPMQAESNKQKILNALSTLADDAPFEEALERLCLLAKVERAEAQLNAGQFIEHEDAGRQRGQKKQRVLGSLKLLADDASSEDIIEHLHFLISIEEGIADLDAGRFVTHDEMKRRFGL